MRGFHYCLNFLFQERPSHIAGTATLRERRYCLNPTTVLDSLLI